MQQKRVIAALAVGIVIWGWLPTGVAHPIVGSLERLGSQVPTEQFGQTLLNELQCRNCHNLQADSGWQKTAPILTNVGSRIKADYFRAFVTAPHQVKPGTTMPSVFHDMDPKQAEQEATAIWQFLKSKSPDPPAVAYARIGSKERGQLLYESVGCLACHDSKAADAQPLADSVPHGNLMAKYTLPTLTEFLRDPHAVRTSGRMPSLDLSTNDAADIASYLLAEVPEQAGIAVKLYQGSWQALPDFDSLEPADTKGVDAISATPFGNRDNFGLRFDCTIQIDNAGDYAFYLHSDDGSRLLIDGDVVIDHDGVHGGTEKPGKVNLAAGRHLLRIDFFEAQGGEELRLTYAAADGQRLPVESLVVNSVDNELQAEPETELDANLIRTGQQLFVQRGCVACHQVDGVQVEAKGVPYENVNRGCLSETVSDSAVDFQLSDLQRTALQAALQAKGTSKPKSESQIQATLLAFNCYACHQRGEWGGVAVERNAAFQGTQPEMGDEGRIPPHLTGVGAKLTSEWLGAILSEGAKDRPYMLTRMPKFGAANIGHLRSLLEETDQTEALEDLALGDVDAKQAGRMMVGERGFACIKCHTFGRFEATGIQSIDMTKITKRLRKDWFRRYVRNPQEFRQGTRMPSAWPVTGKSQLTELYDADSDKQIVAVWEYLSDGNRARIPAGLTTDPMELIPVDEPMIYRNFIQDAGSRAIAVGYPETVHLAFDANQMRLALLWKGAFIDARRHWTGRGQGFEGPQGTNVVAFGDEPAFAVLADVNQAWPKQADDELQFRGYRLDAQRRPEFLYSFQRAEIADKFVPVDGLRKTVFQRTVQIRANESMQNVYFRLGTAPSIQHDQTNGAFQFSSGLTVTLSAEAAPLVRQVGGESELLVPLQLTDGQQLIQIRYDW